MTIRSIVTRYEEIQEKVEEIAKRIYREERKVKGIKTHHGAAHGLNSFSIADDMVFASLDTSCCGSLDSDSVSFSYKELADAMGESY